MFPRPRPRPLLPAEPPLLPAEPPLLPPPPPAVALIASGSLRLTEPRASVKSSAVARGPVCGVVITRAVRAEGESWEKAKR